MDTMVALPKFLTLMKFASCLASALRLFFSVVYRTGEANCFQALLNPTGSLLPATDVHDSNLNTCLDATSGPLQLMANITAGRHWNVRTTSRQTTCNPLAGVTVYTASGCPGGNCDFNMCRVVEGGVPQAGFKNCDYHCSCVGYCEHVLLALSGSAGICELRWI